MDWLVITFTCLSLISGRAMTNPTGHKFFDQETGEQPLLEVTLRDQKPAEHHGLTNSAELDRSHSRNMHGKVEHHGHPTFPRVVQEEDFEEIVPIWEHTKKSTHVPNVPGIEADAFLGHQKNHDGLKESHQAHEHQHDSADAIFGHRGNHGNSGSEQGHIHADIPGHLHASQHGHICATTPGHSHTDTSEHIHEDEPGHMHAETPAHTHASTTGHINQDAPRHAYPIFPGRTHQNMPKKTHEDTHGHGHEGNSRHSHANMQGFTKGDADDTIFRHHRRQENPRFLPPPFHRQSNPAEDFHRSNHGVLGSPHFHARTPGDANTDYQQEYHLYRAPSTSWRAWQSDAEDGAMPLPQLPHSIKKKRSYRFFDPDFRRFLQWRTQMKKKILGTQSESQENHAMESLLLPNQDTDVHAAYNKWRILHRMKLSQEDLAQEELELATTKKAEKSENEHPSDPNDGDKENKEDLRDSEANHEANNDDERDSRERDRRENEEDQGNAHGGDPRESSENSSDDQTDREENMEVGSDSHDGIHESNSDPPEGRPAESKEDQGETFDGLLEQVWGIGTSPHDAQDEPFYHDRITSDSSESEEDDYDRGDEDDGMVVVVWPDGNVEEEEESFYHDRITDDDDDDGSME